VTLRRSLASLTLTTLALAACANTDDGSGSGTDPQALVGHGWTLDQASMASLVDVVPAGAVVTLTFEDGQASGRAACNSYGGGYDAGDDGALSFEGFAVTEMGCEAPLMTVESAYLEALSTVTGFRIDSALILHGDQVDLTFDEEVPPVPLPLVGTAWTLTTIASGDAVSSVLNGTEITAEFTADGTVSGTAGCNRYSGSYTRMDDQLSFSALASTKMACADDVMAQESAFFASMERVASYAIDGAQLSVFDASGALLLGFDGTAA
jgi:heat shock protein HslJ